MPKKPDNSVPVQWPVQIVEMNELETIFFLNLKISIVYLTIIRLSDQLLIKYQLFLVFKLSLIITNSCFL